jgi:hypothetical protein
MDDLPRPTDFKRQEGLETTKEDLSSLLEYYQACGRFLKSLGDLVRKEDPPLFKIIQGHLKDLSPLPLNVDDSLEQPDGRKKGARPKGPYKNSWKNAPADSTHRGRKGSVAPTHMVLRSQENLQL